MFAIEDYWTDIDYWNEHRRPKLKEIYQGDYCSNYSSLGNTKCAYIYDENSNVYQYVEAYKTYLEEQGSTIREARLLSAEEAYELGCDQESVNLMDFPNPWLFETSYWAGSMGGQSDLWTFDIRGLFHPDNFVSSNHNGVRPVIVI